VRAIERDLVRGGRLPHKKMLLATRHTSMSIETHPEAVAVAVVFGALPVPLAKISRTRSIHWA
jgi:hypothetical protein